MKNLKQLIEQHTNDGVIDYKSIEDAVNAEINNVVAKNKPNKEQMQEEFKNEWIASLGFDGVTNENQLKAYVSRTVDESKLELSNVQKQFDEFKERHSDYDEIKSSLGTMKAHNLLRSKGISDNDQIEFLAFKVGKYDGETFEDKLAAFEEANPKTFQNKNITTGYKITNKIPEGEKLGFETELEKMGKL